MLKNVWIGQHLSGTCKMGPDNDGMAVVDQYGRVHGIEGLRVADASIMPDCIRANTNLTTIMIGERIADWIANA
jgi:choline dehydrogenase-like flavoprotein